MKDVQYFNILNSWLGNTEFYEYRSKILFNFKIGEQLIEVLLKCHEFFSDSEKETFSLS